ncbi:MerR family transcriptional regulator [Gorillibacterium timonense]|uniref:MerR family transcriptional regulator n=1 Tax=Gorillibacterium timonense TaxID=1689269 RepID=UPI00071C4B0E|nr:MerR family transcriptional regulator [Gorillibacterium timonense]
MTEYLRGQLAELAGVNLETLRYYEEKGLLPPPRRSDTGYRLYTEEALLRLTFVKNAKSCGFTLKEIRKALVKSGSVGIPLEEFAQVIDRKLASTEKEIAALEVRKTILRHLKQEILSTDPQPDIRATLRELRMDEAPVEPDEG